MIRQISLFILLAVSLSCNRPVKEIPLEGQWDLCLDSISDPKTIRPELLNFSMTVGLPGTLDEAGIGYPVKADTVLSRKAMLHLQRAVSYVGPAYYRRSISIPAGWRNRQISILLERVIWESTVWVDAKRAGSRHSLSTPHEYDLSQFLTPGRHTLIICIDNSRKFVISRGDMAHAFTEETQIKWNGILGRFSLKANNNDHIGNVAVYPYFAGKSISGKIGVSGTENGKSLIVNILDDNGLMLADTILAVTGPNTGFRLDLPRGIKPWNEFNPRLYQVKVTLVDEQNDAMDTCTTEFGFRDIAANDRHLTLNGERLFLRGTLECWMGFGTKIEKQVAVEIVRELFQQQCIPDQTVVACLTHVIVAVIQIDAPF